MEKNIDPSKATECNEIKKDIGIRDFSICQIIQKMGGIWVQPFALPSRPH